MTAEAQTQKPFPGEPIHKPLSDLEVTLEANRCLYCYDAPCTKACPTHIDIASFIAKIADGNLKGSARTILEANPMGASCARVCPVEELCEGACVYNPEDSPIRIGDLQRYAVDSVMRSGEKLFAPGKPTGKSVAIIGGGPAGLSAARDLRRYGHVVTIFEAKQALGGLNTYGIVPFRLELDVAVWEAQYVVEMGCVVRTGVRVGEDVKIESLLKDFDAIVLACGMGGVPKLGIPGDELAWDALEFIERAKLSRLPKADLDLVVGKRVAVIGAGNTAIDALTCAKRLGAERVTMHYRRGEEHMTAYEFEYIFAKQEGIEFRFFFTPSRIVSENGKVRGIELVRTQLCHPEERPGEGAPAPAQPSRRASGKAALQTIPGSELFEEVEVVISAIGQSRLTKTFDALGIAHDGGVVRVDDNMKTSRPEVFAAGDCIFAKGMREAMVVEAAQQGKIAARSVNEYLGGA